MSHFPIGPDPLGPHRRKFMGLGLVLIILGLLAVLFPLVASIAVKVMLGWLFLLTGAAVLSLAFAARDWQSALPAALIGVLQLSAGVYLAFFPLTGLVGLTLFLGLMFLLQGMVEAVIAAQHRPRAGWVWLGLSGMASVLVGGLLIAGLPETATWALGLLIGVNLLTSGISFLALSRVG